MHTIFFLFSTPATPVTPGPVPFPEAAWAPYPSIAEASLAYALGATWTKTPPEQRAAFDTATAVFFLVWGQDAEVLRRTQATMGPWTAFLSYDAKRFTFFLGWLPFGPLWHLA